MAITPRMSGLGAQPGGTSITIALGGAFVAGDCCVVAVVLQDTTKSVSSFTDDTTGGPMVFTQRATFTGAGVKIELWSTSATGGLTGGTFVSVNLSGSCTADATLDDFSGVLALGTTATNNAGTANPTISLFTQDANNYVCAGFGSVGATLATALTGSMRRSQSSGGGSPVVSTITDNTAASASSVVNAVTLAATTWVAAALELRSVTGGLTGTQRAYKQARAGIMRAAASRANYFTYNVLATIAGTDRSAYVQWDSVRITQALNDEPDTASFRLTPSTTFTVSAGQSVAIALGCSTNYEFAGQIVRVSKEYGPTKDIVFTTVDCIDYGRLLDRRIVLTEYTGLSATDIAGDLLATFTTGFTGHGIAPGLPIIDNFPVTNETTQSAYKRLANLINGAFYVDAYRDVHLFGPAGDVAPNAGTNPQTVTDTSTRVKAFRSTADVSQLRTRVIVEGEGTTAAIGSPARAVTGTSGLADYLIVGGGAAGGASAGNANGGGGGGGVLSGSDSVSAGAYAITIGTGGAAAGASGTSSTFNSHTASGGGGGAAGGTNGTAGGSGGGGGGQDNATGSGGAGTAGQGHNGGSGGSARGCHPCDPSGSGGGGGAGGDGASGGFTGGSSGSSIGGAGGSGIASAITGTTVYYGAGGGGGGGNGSSGGTGGTGGGGNGGTNGAGGNASGTGAGGGGSYNSATAGTGTAGAVILSYRTTDFSATGGTITTSGTRTIHTFTSNGTFTVSSVTTSIPPVAITDFPLTDAARINATAGTVRIGNHAYAYTAVLGPQLTPGTNPPGTSLTADAAIGAASLTVTSGSGVFTTTPGWVKVEEQYVRFTSAGATSLTIPATGYGALAAPVKSGAAVTWIGALQIASTVFDPAFPGGTDVVQRVTVDDATAQSTVSGIEGGDGIHEQIITDSRLTISGAQGRGTADLSTFSTATGIIEAEWVTDDANARPGRQQAVNYGGLTQTLLITRAEVTVPVPGTLPIRHCTASSMKQPGLDDAVVTQRN